MRLINLHRVMRVAVSIVQMSMVTEPDNRRDKGDRDSNLCNGPHDAFIPQWAITLSYTSGFLISSDLLRWRL